MPSLADAHALDAADPLARFRDDFVLSGGTSRHTRRSTRQNGGGSELEVIYADGNSLGRLPRATVERLQRVVQQEWGEALIGSWESWIDLPHRVGDLIGVEILGARAGETVVADSTTVNLYKLAVASGCSTVITDEGNFPTDRFVLQGLPGVRVEKVRADPTPEDIADALRHSASGTGNTRTLVALSHVSYFSGARLDLPAITTAAHDAGALVLWDLSHAAGAIAVDLAANKVDLAVGCTYKYLNGGPGSPAFLYVRADLHDRLPGQQPIQGWFGARDPFAMQHPTYEPAPGIGRFVSGTPSVLGLAAIEEGAAIVARASIDAIATKAAALTTFLIACADEHLDGLGFDVITPRVAQDRGAHVSLRHPEAWRICRALIERLGVVPDFREPDVVRLGLAPLYSRYAEAWHTVQRLRTAVADKLYEDLPTARRRVT